MPQQASIRISDLPREQKLAALYARAAETEAEWRASRAPKPSLWQRLRGHAA